MHPVERVFCADLLRPLDAELTTLLRGFVTEDWARPTVCLGWTVKDIAAHLLDGNVRRLSLRRVPPDKPITSYRGLVGFLNELNATWVTAARRISPRLLIDWLEQTGAEVCAFLETLDPEAPAMFGAD